MRKIFPLRFLIGILFVMSCSMLDEGCTTGDYKLSPTKDSGTLFGVYIPKDVNDAHRELKKMLPARLVTKMKSGTKEDMIKYHFGLGMWIRNNWGLWQGSRLSKYFNEIGVYHPDDMSGIILDTFWCDLNGKPQRITERIAAHQEYWKSMEEPKEGSPIDDAKIRWLITQFPKDNKPKGTVHLGLSVSDKTGWRYEYGSSRGIEPATPEENIELDAYRTGFDLK